MDIGNRFFSDYNCYGFHNSRMELGSTTFHVDLYRICSRYYLIQFIYEKENPIVRDVQSGFAFLRL